MKTARFSQLVSTAGKPKVHLLLIDPKRDREFQSALKANRVLTIHQQNVGSKRDVGSVGYDDNGPIQVLVFPKSLKQFAGANVVGIDYEVLEEGRRTSTGRSHSAAKTRVSKTQPLKPKKAKAIRALDQGRQVAAYRRLVKLV